MSASYLLRAEGGPYIGQSYPLSGSTTLGREAGNAITLPDNQLSRRHARFDASSRGLTVTDLGSANGVYVNGQRINGLAILHPGDTVGVGESIFRVEARADDPAVGFAPPQDFPPVATRGTPGVPTYAPGAPPYAALPMPPSPPSAPRRSFPLALLVATGMFLLLFCVGSGAVVALLATRGGTDPTPSVVSAGGAAVPAAGGAGSTKRQAGTVAGRITTAAGQPLPAGATAKVTISGNAIGGQINTYEPAVDAQGRYSQRVAEGLYSVIATVTFPYNGGVLKYYAHPNDNQSRTQTFDSKDGLVKDFTWKLSGLIYSSYDPKKPDSSYGQYLTLSADSSLKFPAGSSIEFTFTPRGPLADGSTGQTVKRTIQSTEVATGSYLSDLPLGPYTVTVALVGSQARALQFCIVEGLDRCASDPAKLSTQGQLDWHPTGSGLGTLQMYISLKE